MKKKFKSWVGKSPGKRKKRIVKKEKNIPAILFFTGMFFFGLFLSFYSAFNQYSQDSVSEVTGNITASLPQHNLVISYEGLTKEEINQVNGYINEIDPIYITDRQREIRFVSNITPYCESCWGVNYRDGLTKITINSPSL